MIKKPSISKKEFPKWFFPLIAVVSFLASVAGIILVFKPGLVQKVKEWPQNLKDRYG